MLEIYQQKKSSVHLSTFLITIYIKFSPKRLLSLHGKWCFDARIIFPFLNSSNVYQDVFIPCIGTITYQM
jgi:hypothetical protein